MRDIFLLIGCRLEALPGKLNVLGIGIRLNFQFCLHFSPAGF